jgi:hypothetical protein
MVNSRLLLTIISKNKILLPLMVILVVALITDTSLIKTSVLTTSESGSATRVKSFVIILSITVAGQFAILAFVRHQTMEIRRKKEIYINTINNVVTTIQFIVIGILVFVILQILLTSQYFVDLVITAFTISSLLAIVMLALLAQRFFLWLKVHRNSMILSIGLSSAIMAISTMSALFFVDLVLSTSQIQRIIVPHLGENIPFLIPGSDLDNLNTANNILSIASFMMMWVAACILLRHYSLKLGKVKYWALVSIPLIYFLSQYLTLSLNLFAPLLSSPQSIFYGILLTLAFTISSSTGGILFGIAFWSVARGLHKSSIVRNYMIISAYGLVLLFTSNQATVLVNASYPPFGLATASIIGLSSYLVLLGIYSSAISVSEDSELRRSIRTFAVKESKLLDSIGSAQMEQEIIGRVIPLVKQQRHNIIEETGIQPSLTEEDIKQYLEDVLAEIGRKK